MSNEEAIANIIRLVTSFHLDIKALPDDLKCTKCKSVLKNAYQMPCDCRFCRACIDDVISRGDQFCPGGSQECGATPLSTAVPDYRANKSVLKLTAKCPHSGCPHEFPLADVESHISACSRKNIDCPFHELGCAQGALPGDEMSGHLLQEIRSHSEILIGTVANISRYIEMLKDELERHLENATKLVIDKNKSIKNKIKLIKIENESIKRENEVLCDRVRQLSEKLEREIDERRQSDERNSAMAIAVTAEVASNRNEMEPIRDDIRSVSELFAYMKCQMESIQVAVGMGQLDDWLIKEDLSKTDWVNSKKTSGTFGGEGCAHTFELSSENSVSKGEFEIYLFIWAGPSASLVDWPFRGAVTVTVARRGRREAYSRLMQQCWINRPRNNQYNVSRAFVFSHTKLRVAGVDLERGVRVSCQIVRRE